MRARDVRFLHCERCGTTARISPASAGDEMAAFRRAHETCPVETFEPTGCGTASTTWNDPMAVRRLEVRGAAGLAMAVGARRLLDEPLVWRIERHAPEEQTEIELDRTLFWAVVDRAIYPAHVPLRALDEWAAQIEHYVRSAPASDIVLLEDDPAAGDATFACLTLTSRARLEAALPSFGFDAEIEERLERLFDEELFPPLRVRRRLDAPSQAARAAAEPPVVALTR